MRPWTPLGARFALTVLVLSAMACHRRVYSPTTCPGEPDAMSVSSVTAAPNLPSTILGHVIDARDLQRIPRGEARLEPLGRVAPIDSTGAFRFDSVPPGRYIVWARSIGYQSRGMGYAHISATNGARVQLALTELMFCP